MCRQETALSLTHDCRVCWLGFFIQSDCSVLISYGSQPFFKLSPTDSLLIFEFETVGYRCDENPRLFESGSE